ncbi:mediator of RNA polymerase II transcription subunit 32-like protein [Tanacetum coccineum]
MDTIIDAMNNAYQELINAVANTHEAKEALGGQMSKAVRLLVNELQQGSRTARNLSVPQHSLAPFDARFHEDSAQ